MRRAIALPGLVVGTLATAGCAGVFGDWYQVEETFHYQYPISPGGTLELENQDGAVEISGWDRNEVDVSGTKYASSTDRLKDTQVDVKATSGSISIRTVRPDSNWERGSVRYVIRVPRGVELARVETSNSPVDVDGTDAAVHLHTSNGPVRVTDVRGEIEVETSNGPVRIVDASGPARIRTSNGPIDLAEDSVHEVHARTSNGPITLRLPSGAGAMLRAHSSNGSLHSDFDIRTSDSERNDVAGTIGGGGPMLDLSTSNGPIQLLKR
jgi:DUF4097 and DUF4098 domain-containing protein YvlB